MGLVVRVNLRLAGIPCFNRHIANVQHEIRGVAGVDCPADYFPRMNDSHTAAIYFPLAGLDSSGLVFGDVRAPQLVKPIRGELTAHEIRGRN